MAKVKFPVTENNFSENSEELVADNLKTEHVDATEDKNTKNEFENSDLGNEMLENELKFAKSEIEDWKNKATRLTADIQNLNKQSELDLVQAKKSAKKNSIGTILTFLNTLNLAFSFVPETEDQKMLVFVETLKTSFDKALQDLKTIGVEVLVPAIGENFNPELMSLLNSPEDLEPKIKQVVTLGIKIDGVLVQPASVLA